MSFRAKFHHAMQQTKALDAEMDAWVETEPYAVAEHIELKTGETVIAISIREQPPSRLSLGVGDCLHSLRDSLDHLALELAERYTSPLPATARDSSEFPIWFKTPTMSQLKQKIGSVDPAAQAIIKALQPHHRTDPTRDPLWILNRLCNIDKHQTLHLVGLSKTGIEVIPGDSTIQSINYADGALDDGAELARFLASPSPKTGKVEVQLNITSRISFSEGPPAFGAPVSQALWDIRQRIINDVFGPLAPFLR